MGLRAATPADLPAITAIFNDVIANTLAIWSEAPLDLADRQAWYDARIAQSYPVLVFDDGGEVLGLASYGAFRAWPEGYRHTVEHSVHVRADQRGRGLGRVLLGALLDEARGHDVHVMVGAIDSENTASLRLHAALGFEQVAHFRSVGRKWGRWLDAIFVQRHP